jgi:type I restriction enzyme M protein
LDTIGTKVENSECTTLSEKIIETIKTVGNQLYKKREDFVSKLEDSFKSCGLKLGSKLKKSILENLSERDSNADVCLSAIGESEPDSELRDFENIPFPSGISLPLPLGYDNETGLDEVIELVKNHCEEYMKSEVLPFVPDAWIDYSKTKIGYEIPVTKLFYVYKPPRDLQILNLELETLANDIIKQIKELQYGYTC